MGLPRPAYAGATRGMRYVRRTPGNVHVTERKYFDGTRAATAIASNADWTATEHDITTVNCLFAPQQGNSISTRVGTKVTVKNLRINGLINLPAAANATAGRPAVKVRLVLVQDMQTNTAQAQGEEVFSSTGTNAPEMFQNTNNFGRFKVLRDKTYILQNPNTSWDGTNIESNNLIKSFKMKYKWRNGLDVRFNSTNGGTVADIVDHSFHLLAIASNATDGPTLRYNVRVVFCDP